MNELHNKQLKPFSQKILGNYIADFYIAAEKIVIELDGSQHYMGNGIRSDRDRDAWM